MKSQLPLFKIPHTKKFFGGSLLNGRRKGTRPLSHDQALHIVLKSQWARGRNALTHKENKNNIEKLIQNVANRYNIRVYRYAIVSNHIHLIIRAKRRHLYRAFICVITGQIAQHVMKNQSFKNFIKTLGGEGVTRGQKTEKGQAFWQHRPFTRILNWGKDYVNCMSYLLRNTLEALGFIKYTARRDYYAQWRLKVSPESG